MGSRQQSGLNDNLIRWVHRHDRMATLFRSAQPGSSLSSSLQNPSFSRGVPVVPSVDPGTLPQEQSVETQPVRPVSAPPVQRQSQAASATAPVPPPPSGQPSIAAPSEISQASETKDRDWQRLQNIFRKHQAPKDADSSSPPAAALPDGKPPVEPERPEPQRAAERRGETNEQPRSSPAIFRKPELPAPAANAAPARTAAQPGPLKPVAGDESKKNIQRQQEESGQRVQSIPRTAEDAVETKPAPLPQPSISQSVSDVPTQIDSSGRDKKPNLIQRAWQGVGSLFRRGQKPGQTKTEGAQETTQSAIDPIEMNELESSLNEKVSLRTSAATETKPPSIPVQRSTTATLSSGSVQRTEPVEAKNQYHEPTESLPSPSLDEQGQSARTAGAAEPKRPSRPVQPSTTAVVSSSTVQRAEHVEAKNEYHEPTTSLPSSSLDQQGQSARTAAAAEPKQTSVPVQRSTTAAFPSNAVQRAAEPVEVDTLSHGSREIQPTANTEAPETKFGVHSSEGTPTGPDEDPATERLPQQPVPLESVWNVQRLESPDADVHEPTADVDDVMKEPDQSSSQHMDRKPMGFSGERKQSAESNELPSTYTPPSVSSGTPVEILPPSRPRPAQTSVMPSRRPVQRQPEDRETSFVNTAIGPLPSDLWSLLGQKPPAASVPTEREMQTTRPIASSGDQKIISAQTRAASPEGSTSAAPAPAVVQRQAVSDIATASVSQQPAEPARREETPQAEPDLDDLAQKVYAEVRRLLAVEAERTNRYF